MGQTMKVLQTERLILRNFTLDDLDDFHEYCSVEGVGESAGWATHTSMEESEKWLNKFIQDGHTYCLVDKSSGKVIGSIGVEERNNDTTNVYASFGYVGKNVEIGYVLAKDYWGKGLMPEAVSAVVESCFCDLGVDYVAVGHFPNNQRSRRVIEKCGFKYVATREKAYELYNGEKVDECIYAYSAVDFFKKKFAEKRLAVAIVGMCGSGKSVLAELFETLGWQRVYFGGVTVTKLKEENQEVNEKNERAMREGLRARYGMSAFAVLLKDEIEAKLRSSCVVLDGLYSWSEYTYLKPTFGDNLVLLSVICDRNTRYQRLAKRLVRPLTSAEAQSRDYSEIENLEKGGPIAFADFHISNDLSEDCLRSEFYVFLGKLLQKT